MKQLIKIAVIGDFERKRPSHIATHEALQHAAESISLTLDIQWIATKPLEHDVEKQGLKDFNGMWGAPGVPRSSYGVINAIRFAREKGIPYVGT